MVFGVEVWLRNGESFSTILPGIRRITKAKVACKWVGEALPISPRGFKSELGFIGSLLVPREGTMKAQAVDEKIARVFLHWAETMQKPRAASPDYRGLRSISVLGKNLILRGMAT